MSRLSIVAASVCVICILFVVLAFCSFAWLHEPNTCRMTYMYQYPEYIPVNLPEEATRLFPRYGLYIYGEGEYALRLRTKPLEGIPVLFIPGNAGSYKQVRSLASVALMKQRNYVDELPPEFNYFTIDFDEELSGLFGGFLRGFAAVCLHRIMSLYSHLEDPPQEVIVIGHSMGGMVARGMVTVPFFNSSFVKLIITLATPHIKPVISFDWDLSKYYSTVNLHWARHRDTSLANISVVSIAGGERDLLVRSDLTFISSYIVRADKAFHVFTSAMPYVWRSTDHLCIVWCNELVRAVNRILFDTFDSETGRLSNDTESRLRTIRYHLFNHMGFESIKTLNEIGAEIEYDSKKKQVRHLNESDVQLILSSPKTRATVLYKKFIPQELIGYSIFIATNQNKPDFFFVRCNSEIGCEKAIPIGAITLIPPSYRILTLYLNPDLQGETVMPVTVHHSPRKALLYKLYPTLGHQAPIKVGSIHHWKFRWNISGQVVVYNLTLFGFSSLAQAFRARLITLHCDNLENGF